MFDHNQVIDPLTYKHMRNMRQIQQKLNFDFDKVRQLKKIKEWLNFISRCIDVQPKIIQFIQQMKYLTHLIVTLTLIQLVSSSCSSPCIQCSELDPNKCSVCSEGFYLSSSAGSCAACIENCRACTQTSFPKCFDCISEYYFDESRGQCIVCSISNCDVCNTQPQSICDICQLTYYGHGTETCKSCIVADCDVCNTNPQYCDKCSEGYLSDDKGGCECTVANCAICNINPKAQCESCKQGYYLVGVTVCKPCIQGCIDCATSIAQNQKQYKCTSCEDGYFLEKGLCLKCLGQNCKTCTTDPHSCTTCPTGFRLSSGKCKCTVANCQVCDINPATLCSQCAPSFYLNDYKTNCLACIADCASCEDADDPLNQCVRCMTGFFVDSTLRCTTACSVANCMICDSNPTIHCDACQVGHTLSADKTSCECDVENCQVCNVADPTICDLCANGYTAEDETNKRCLPCMINNCDICDTSLQICDTCLVGFIGDGTQLCQCQPNCQVCSPEGGCVKCNDHYYIDLATKKCTVCSENCKDCTFLDGTVSGTKCEECFDEFVVEPNNEVCIACHANCKNCKFSDTHSFFCEVCSEGSYIGSEINPCRACNDPTAANINCQDCTFTDGTSPGTQCQVCFPGFYINSGTGFCRPCNDPTTTNTNCKDCTFTDGTTAGTKCQVCLDGFFVNSADGFCDACPSGCKTCDGTACLSCVDPFHIPSGSICVCAVSNCATGKCSIRGCDQCAQGYYQQFGVTTQCLSCSVQFCKICNQQSRPGICGQCRTGFQLSEDKTSCFCDLANCKVCSHTINKCEECYEGNYVNVGTGQCLSCDTNTVSNTNCKDCTFTDGTPTGTKCQVCNDGFFLNPSDGFCDACDSIVIDNTNCKDCTFNDGTTDGSKCSICIDGFFLNPDDGFCDACDSTITQNIHCKDCTFTDGTPSGTKCQACLDDLFFLNSVNGLCSPCMSQFPTLPGAQCEFCTQTRCLTCIVHGYIPSQEERKCICSVENCEVCNEAQGTLCDLCCEGFFRQADNSQCIPCPISHCKSCPQPYHQNFCRECFVGYKLNPDQNKCECDPTQCLVCSASGQCTKCNSFNYIHPKTKQCTACTDNISCQQCQPNDPQICLKCKTGSFLDGSTCKPCSNNACLDCTGGDSQADGTKCFQCEQGYALSSNQQSCVACESNCQQCDLDNCIVCRDNFYINPLGGCTNCINNCVDCITGLSTDSDRANKCSICDIGYALTQQSTCSLCLLSNCQKCTTVNACEKCTPGFFAEEVSSHEKLCQICSSKLSGCFQCNDDASECFECQQGFYLNEKDCAPCPEGCPHCQKTMNGVECPQCSDEYQFYDNKCFRCSPTCVGCVKNSEDCETCILGFELIDAADSTNEKRCIINQNCSPQNCGACVPGNNDQCANCMPGFYNILGQCFKCHFSCRDCKLVIGDVLTTALKTETQAFQDELQAEGGATEVQGDRIFVKTTVIIYEQQALYLLGKYLGFLKTNYPFTLGTLDAIAKQYKENLHVIDDTTFETLKISATATYNKLTGSSLTEDQFVLQTIQIVQPQTQCTACVERYGLDNNEKCLPCKDDCQECTYSGSTQTCSSCQPGTYGTAICLTCDVKCKTCSSANTCTSCYAGFRLNDNQCLQCKPPCETCFESDPEKCIKCVMPFAELANRESSCYRCQQDLCKKCDAEDSVCEQCVEGSFLFDGRCGKCPKNCKECTNLHCVECLGGYTRNQITGLCQPCGIGCLQCIQNFCMQSIDGFYPNYQGKSMMCSDGCAKCSSLGECRQYKKKLVMINEQLVKCPTGCSSCDRNDPIKCITCDLRHYEDGDQCRRCSSDCQKCNSLSTCTRCTSSTFLKDGACIKCQGQCRECEHNAPANCTSCKRGFNLNKNTKKCTKSCPENCLQCNTDGICQIPDEGYGLQINGMPIKCLRQCSGTCDPRDINICLSCTDGFQLEGNQCTRCPFGCAVCLNGHCETCFQGFSLKQQNGNIVCKEDCSEQCKQCQEGVCTECYAGFQIINGQCTLMNCSPNCDYCVSGTLKGETSAIGKACLVCPANCAACSDVNTCLTCFEGFYLGGDGVCTVCSSTCIICNDESSCNLCVDGYVLELIAEGETISDNVYGHACIACSDRCKTCAIEPDICTSCRQGFRVKGTTCFSSRVVRVEVKLDIDYPTFIKEGGTQTAIIDPVAEVTDKDAKSIDLLSVDQDSIVFEVEADSEEESEQIVKKLLKANYGGHKTVSIQAKVYEDDVLVKIDDAEVPSEQEVIAVTFIVVGVVVGGVLILVIGLIVYKAYKANKVQNIVSKINETSQIIIDD